MHKLNVLVDLKDKRVESVEVPSDDRSIAGYMLIRGAIQNFSQEISQSLSEKKSGQVKGNGKMRA